MVLAAKGGIGSCTVAVLPSIKSNLDDAGKHAG
jgi:hypothetical protein